MSDKSQNDELVGYVLPHWNQSHPGLLEALRLSQAWEQKGAFGLPPLPQVPGDEGISADDTWRALFCAARAETSNKRAARVLFYSRLLRRLSDGELSEIHRPLTDLPQPPNSPWKLVIVDHNAWRSGCVIDALCEHWPYRQRLAWHAVIIDASDGQGLMETLPSEEGLSRQRMFVVVEQRLRGERGADLLAQIKRDRIPDRWLSGWLPDEGEVLDALEAGQAMAFLPTDIAEIHQFAARIWGRAYDPVPEALQALRFVEPHSARAAQYQRLANAWLRFAPEEREGAAPLGPLGATVWALQMALLRERDALLKEIGDEPYYSQ